MTNPHHLRLHELNKVYNDTVRAVDDVDLEVAEGEFVTLVGPSGCGKSTTLRMLAGFVEPTAGSIEMNFTDITSLPPEKRDVGMVFQSIALFPHLTVKENIAYGLRVSNESFSEEEIDDRVAEMLELIEMAGYQDRRPEQLSGGQAQRVGLARALAPRPEVLLLDEPLSALDEKLREHMQTELTRIQKQLGVTTIFVTHNQEEAMTMSDRIVVMNDGHFEQIGTPEEIYTEPQSVFVGDFMGKSNLFEGTVGREGTTPVLETGDRTFTVETDLPEGRAAQLLVRPENLSIVDNTSTTNALTGEIELVQLVGAVVEYEVDLDDGRTITVAEQSAGAIEFERGDRITVAFEPEDTVIFPADTGDGGVETTETATNVDVDADASAAGDQNTGASEAP